MGLGNQEGEKKEHTVGAAISNGKKRTSYLKVVHILKGRGTTGSDESAEPERQGQLAVLLLLCSQLPVALLPPQLPCVPGMK